MPNQPSADAPATSYDQFRAARDGLIARRLDQPGALAWYRAPRPAQFNWGLDWLDRVAANQPTARRPALKVVEPDGSSRSLTYEQMAQRSTRLAGWLDSIGVRRGDRVLLMLGNQVELWETMLAAIKLGAVLIPATTLLTGADIRERIERGRVRHVVLGSADAGKLDGIDAELTRIAVGRPVPGWHTYADFEQAPDGFVPSGRTAGTDTLLLYFTSGTTASPKLVEHTHVSYPVGHLSTMYWIGLQPGDVHLNISSPGWAKHAWSSVFAPWNAEATILVVNQARFDAEALLEAIAAEQVSTFCAPPTVYRMLIQQDLAAWRGRMGLREMVGAGEPLNPEVIVQVDAALGITIRDGYGQTETTAQVGNCPGQQVVPGSMGRPLPGYEITLIDPASGQVRDQPGQEGEICLPLDGSDGRPVGLMVGYHGDAELTEEAMSGGAYHTGDVASSDEHGYITYVGRADDVFKASDYRISPFELESVLIEHPAVAEAAIVPSPDPVRLNVPKAYVVLSAGHEPDAATARDILAYAREHLAPYKRIRRIEFPAADVGLPKTISGKIRRVELRRREDELHGSGEPTTRAGDTEFWETDFPDLRAGTEGS